MFGNLLDGINRGVASGGRFSVLVYDYGQDQPKRTLTFENEADALQTARKLALGIKEGQQRVEVRKVNSGGVVLAGDSEVTWRSKGVDKTKLLKNKRVVKEGGAKRSIDPKTVTVYDNGGETADRYTIFFEDVSGALGLGDDCDSPQGFSQWGDAVKGPHLGKVIPWEDLPDNVRNYVQRERIVM